MTEVSWFSVPCYATSWITYTFGDYIRRWRLHTRRCRDLIMQATACIIRPLDTNNRGLRQVSANILSACPPSSRVSPFCLRQSPTGRATLGSRTLSGVASLCHSLRWCKKITAHPQLRTLVWCLALATVVAAAPPIPSLNKWVLVLSVQNKKITKKHSFLVFFHILLIDIVPP